MLGYKFIKQPGQPIDQLQMPTNALAEELRVHRQRNASAEEPQNPKAAAWSLSKMMPQSRHCCTDANKQTLSAALLA